MRQKKNDFFLYPEAVSSIPPCGLRFFFFLPSVVVISASGTTFHFNA